MAQGAGRGSGETRPFPPAGEGVDFKAVFEEWLARDQKGNRSMPAVKQRIEREVLPHWGSRKISDIGRRDVLDAIDAVATEERSLPRDASTSTFIDFLSGQWGAAYYRE